MAKLLAGSRQGWHGHGKPAMFLAILPWQFVTLALGKDSIITNNFHGFRRIFRRISRPEFFLPSLASEFKSKETQQGLN